jgi:O-antigen/teichoic acid export membrane protein
VTSPQNNRRRRQPKKGEAEWLDVERLRNNLRSRALSGVAVTITSQGAKLVLQLGYIAIMSRLLVPSDFGLFAMVTSFTAIISVMKDGGLSTATIQRPLLSSEEVTGLFWVNLALGCLLALFTAACAPVVTSFYSEPRLMHVIVIFAFTFVIAGSMVQHEAILRRAMRFKALAAIEVGALTISAITGVMSAKIGLGYWALVIALIAGNLTTAALLWIFSGWRPGPPSWPPGLSSMLLFGSHVMSYNMVSALGMNLDKVLLGRIYGAVELGFYSRAQALLVQPVMQVLTPLGAVAIPTLSRVHMEREKLHEALLGLLLLVGFVSAFASAFIFAGADWIVRLLLGQGWSETAGIVRAFALTVFTMPISVVATWALTITGLGKKLALWGLVNNGILLAAMLCGLSWGAFGVAIAFSVSGVTLRVPLLYHYVAKWTSLSFRHIVSAILPAFVAFLMLSAALFALAQRMQDVEAAIGLSVLGIATLLTAAMSVYALAWGRNVRRTFSLLLSRNHNRRD